MAVIRPDGDGAARHRRAMPPNLRCRWGCEANPGSVLAVDAALAFADLQHHGVEAFEIGESLGKDELVQVRVEGFEKPGDRHAIGRAIGKSPAMAAQPGPASFPARERKEAVSGLA